MFKTLAKDAAIYGVTNTLFRMLNFFVFLLFTYVLTVEEFGHLSLITTVIGLLGVLFVGINNAISRFYWESNLDSSQKQIFLGSGFLFVLLIGSFLIVALSLSLFPLRGWFEERYGFAWIWVVLVFLSILPTQILEFARNLLRLQFSPWKSSLLVALQNGLGALCTLVFVYYLELGVKGYILGLSLSLLLLLPLAFIFMHNQMNFVYHGATGKKLWRFGYPFIFSNLAFWILGSIDRWMIEELNTSAEVGIYSIALRFAMILTFVTGSFGQAWSPHALKAYHDQPDYRLQFSRTFSLWLYFLILMGSALALFSIEILMLFTPRDYWASAQLFPFLMIGTALLGAMEIPAMGVALSQKTKIFGYISWGVVLFNILLNWLLIPSYGSLGASATTFLTYLILIGCYVASSQKLHPLPLEWGKIACLLFMMNAYLALSLMLLQYEWCWTLFLTKAGLMLLGLAFGFWIKVLNFHEMLSSIKQKLTKKTTSLEDLAQRTTLEERS